MTYNSKSRWRSSPLSNVDYCFSLIWLIITATTTFILVNMMWDEGIAGKLFTIGFILIGTLNVVINYKDYLKGESDAGL